MRDDDDDIPKGLLADSATALEAAEAPAPSSKSLTERRRRNKPDITFSELDCEWSDEERARLSTRGGGLSAPADQLRGFVSTSAMLGRRRSSPVLFED